MDNKGQRSARNHDQLRFVQLSQLHWRRGQPPSPVHLDRRDVGVSCIADHVPWVNLPDGLLYDGAFCGTGDGPDDRPRIERILGLRLAHVPYNAIVRL